MSSYSAHLHLVETDKTRKTRLIKSAPFVQLQKWTEVNTKSTNERVLMGSPGYWLTRLVFAALVGLGALALSYVAPNLLVPAAVLLCALVVPLLLNVVWTKPKMNLGTYWVHWFLNGLYAAGLFALLLALNVNIPLVILAGLSFLLTVVFNNWRDLMNGSSETAEMVAAAA